jgi:hypothetical protein
MIVKKKDDLFVFRNRCLNLVSKSKAVIYLFLNYPLNKKKSSLIDSILESSLVMI